MQENTACIAFTSEGANVARRIAMHLGCQATVREKDKHADDIALRQSIREWARERMQDCRCIVFVGATGICVRAVAPWLQGKELDPAVIVVDELACFVIPILSGHLGGANELAIKIAAFLSATPVITTATDVRGIFSVDDWSRKQYLFVENKSMIAPVSSCLLDGGVVGVQVDRGLKIKGELPEGLKIINKGSIGICITVHRTSPFDKTLFLRPKCLVLGIGCKRGMSCERISDAVNAFLLQTGYSEHCIKAVASIDLKINEEGLLAFCTQKGWPFITHNTQELQLVKSDLVFTSSPFVKKITGVDCVCERAAALHGSLTVRKTRFVGITLALSQTDWSITF